ncbi:hypothetical protein [Massilia sp. CCM 8734]|uniref:hypothetical protein n=1 Tax=Massilia sp. CCM 8734 TaxID=2609283 RepID=UPI001420B695|nr:hypothetical protein [Massilia sp. CCM 8734]NHZ94549.1 hypothetical protein [Massilia sp. CCM 8734]
MADLVELGIVVNTAPMVEGAKAMDAMGEASVRVETKVAGATKAVDGMTTSSANVWRRGTEAAKSMDSLGESTQRTGQRAAVSNGQMNDTAKILAYQAEQARQTAQANAALGQSTDRMTLGQQLFIEKLRDQVAVLGMSRTQLLAYQAAELGVTTQTQDLIAKMKQFEDATKAATEASKAAAAAKGQQAQAGITLHNSLELLAKGYAALKVAEYVKDSAMLAARYETLGVVMEVVGRNAGYTKTQMMTATQAIAAQGITMVESRESAVKLVQAHVDLKYATQLARGAQDAAVIGHINSSEAFDRMVNGIARGNVLILRNIGINVNFQSAYREMAEQLGKTTKELTENERVQARTGAVIERLTDIHGTYTAAMDTASKQITSMQRYVMDLKTTLGEVGLDVLTVTVMAVTKGFKDANSEVTELSKNGQLHEWGRSLSGIFVSLANTVSNAYTAMQKVKTWADHKTERDHINTEFDGKASKADTGLSFWDLPGQIAARRRIESQRQAALAQENADYEAQQLDLSGKFDRFAKAQEVRNAAVTAKRKAEADENLKVDATYAKASAAILLKASTEGAAAQALARKKVGELYRETYEGTPTFRDTEGREPKPKAEKVDKVASTVLADKKAQFEAEAAFTKDHLAHMQRMDEMNHKAGEMSDGEFFDRKRKNADDMAAAQIAAFDKQIAALGGYHNATAAEAAKNAKELNAIGAKRAAQLASNADAKAELDNAERLRVKSIASDSDNATNAFLSNLDREAEKLEASNLGYETSRAAIERKEIASLNLAIASQQQLMAEQALGGATAEELAQAPAILKYLEDLRAKRERIALGLEQKDADQYQKKAADRAIQDWERAGNSIADSLSNAFGKGGKAIGAMFKAYSTGMAGQLRAEKELALAKAKRDDDPEKIQAIDRAHLAGAQAQLKSYGDMTEAAQTFFSEGSRGYQAMTAAAGVMRAAEVALSVVKGVNAVLTQGSGDPYTAFARMAAMAAVVVGLGVALTSGGSAGGKSAAEVQKKQGTGSVFGDADAKSESITRSLAMLEENSGALVPINRGMLTALRAIQTAMSGLTNQIIRTPGLTDGSNMGITTGRDGRQSGTGILNIPSLLTGGLFASSIDPLGKMLSNLWGKTTKTIVDAGIQFGGSVRGLQDGKGYNQYASVDTKKTSFFGASKKVTNSVETAALNSDLSAQLGLVFKGVENALSEAATVLGVGADHVKKSLDALTIDVTEISLKGLKGDDLTAELNAVLSRTMDGMAEAVLPDMDGFRKAGEGYTETVVRLASNYATLDQSLTSIGLTFGATGTSSLRARENMIAAAGGIDKFAEQASSFADNFMTEAERLAPVQKYVNEELARLGQTGIKTRDDFKAAVLGLSQGGKLATTAGAELFTGLMALETAFAAVVPSLDKTKTAAEKLSEREGLIDHRDELKMNPKDLATKKRNSVDESNWDVYDEVTKLDLANKHRALEIQNMELAGDKVRSLAATRADEAKGLDAATAELVKRRNALEDANTAAALATKNRGVEIQMMELAGNKTGALAASRAEELVGLEASTAALIKNRNALQDQASAAALAVGGANTSLTGLKNSVGAEKDALTKAYDAQVKAIKDAAPGADSYKGQIDAAKKLTDAVKSVFDKLTSALQSTEIQSTAMDAARRRAAQELLAQAAVFTRGGGTGNIAGLEDALDAISKPSEEMFATFEDYARDQNRAKASLEALQANAKKELDFGQLTVDGLEANSKTIDAASNAQIKVLSESHTAELARLDAMIAAGQKELDAVTGVDTSVKSLADAIKEFTAAITGVKQAPSGLSVEGLYQQVLGRDGEKAGVDFWKKAYGETVDGAEKADFIKNAQPELEAKKSGKWAEFLRSHGVPGYATGGDFGGGLRLVGENGPELEATGPARIFNAGQARSMLSGGSPELLEEVRRLTATVALLKSALDLQLDPLNKSATNTKRLADAFETVTDGNNAMRTKETA